MATLDNNDLKAIQNLIEVGVDEAFEKKGVATKDHLGNLPTKDEFYGKMDQVMSELKAIREEAAVIGHQVSEHDDRINKLEDEHEASN